MKKRVYKINNKRLVSGDENSIDKNSEILVTELADGKLSIKDNGKELGKEDPVVYYSNTTTFYNSMSYNRINKITEKKLYNHLLNFNNGINHKNVYIFFTEIIKTGSNYLPNVDPRNGPQVGSLSEAVSLLSELSQGWIYPLGNRAVIYTVARIGDSDVPNDSYLKLDNKWIKCHIEGRTIIFTPINESDIQ